MGPWVRLCYERRLSLKTWSLLPILPMLPWFGLRLYKKTHPISNRRLVSCCLYYYCLTSFGLYGFPRAVLQWTRHSSSPWWIVSATDPFSCRYCPSYITLSCHTTRQWIWSMNNYRLTNCSVPHQKRYIKSRNAQMPQPGRNLSHSDY